MIKVYLASRYEDRRKLCKIRSWLQKEGIEVTSRWLDSTHERLEDVTEEERVIRGDEDLEDINKADIIVVFSLPEAHGNGTGGRHVELGYSIARGKKVLLVGTRENIFHWNRSVEVVRNQEILPECIKMSAKRMGIK